MRIEPWHRHVRIAGIANFLIGAFLFAWPLALPFPLEEGALKRSLLAVGALTAVCGAARALLPARNLLLTIANMVFGIWILLAPIEFEHQMTWHMVAATAAGGLALMAFAWWSISETLDGRRLESP